MPLALKVISELDEHSARRAADRAERTFADAGASAAVITFIFLGREFFGAAYFVDAPIPVLQR